MDGGVCRTAVATPGLLKKEVQNSEPAVHFTKPSPPPSSKSELPDVIFSLGNLFPLHIFDHLKKWIILSNTLYRRFTFQKNPWKPSLIHLLLPLLFLHLLYVAPTQFP